MAAPFFKSVATEGRLKALYDFENRRTRYGTTLFFPDATPATAPDQRGGKYGRIEI